jgi:amidase
MMLCIAGIGGLPQVHLPLSSYLGAPIGVSIIGGPNRDLDLLELVSK